MRIDWSVRVGILEEVTFEQGLEGSEEGAMWIWGEEPQEGAASAKTLVGACRRVQGCLGAVVAGKSQGVGGWHVLP